MGDAIDDLADQARARQAAEDRAWLRKQQREWASSRREWLESIRVLRRVLGRKRLAEIRARLSGDSATEQGGGS